MQAHVLDHRCWYVAFIAVNVMYSSHHDNSANFGDAQQYYNEDKFLEALVEYEAQGFEIILEEVDYWLRN